MNKFSQIIENKIYPKILTKFKHSKNKEGEIVSQKQSSPNAVLTIKNNKILLFRPLKDIKGKDSKIVHYSCLLDKANSRFVLHDGPFYAKLTHEGKLSERWIYFKNVQPYFRAFNLYKKGDDIQQSAFEITFDIKEKEENQMESEKNNADE